MPSDQAKKRKADDNGAVDLTEADLDTLLENFAKDQLVNLLQYAALRHTEVRKDVRKAADEDPTPRKVFVGGLDSETKAEDLRKFFSRYGEIEDAIVMTERKTQRARGFGFVTFTRLKAAVRALRRPEKTIEGKSVSCKPATPYAGLTSESVTHRKIYAANIPENATFDRVHKFFSQYGEIAEGPIGFEKNGKCKGYCLIVYKTLEGARQALQESLKMFEGNQVRCKLAESAPPTESKPAVGVAAVPAGLAVPSSATGQISGIPLPYLTYNPSGLSTGVALNPGLPQILSNPFALGLQPNLSALALGASVNPSLPLDPYLAALYPSLSSLTSLSSDSAQGLLSGVGHGIHSAGSSLGLASLGAHSGSLAAYPAQLAAYSRFTTGSLYDAGTSSTSQAPENPMPSYSSYAGAHLGATPAERAQIAEALGRVARYYDQ